MQARIVVTTIPRESTVAGALQEKFLSKRTARKVKKLARKMYSVIVGTGMKFEQIDVMPEYSRMIYLSKHGPISLLVGRE